MAESKQLVGLKIGEKLIIGKSLLNFDQMVKWEILFLGVLECGYFSMRLGIQQSDEAGYWEYRVGGIRSGELRISLRSEVVKGG